MSDTPWAELVDVLPEPMTCGRRREQGMDNPNSPIRFTQPGEGLDRWERHKSNGDRVCSYCGSLHPEDFFRLVKESAEAPEDVNGAVHVHRSDKSYKIYIDRPAVKNAHEGGIKFYTQHLETEPTKEQQEIFKEACRRSHIRFERRLGLK